MHDREQFTDDKGLGKDILLEIMRDILLGIQDLHPKSRETSLAITNMEQAIMWLEKA